MVDKIDVWQKAAVLGSVWAASEIVVGNFLHSMKVPFTGEIMTAFAVYLFAATGMRWKEAGIVWRAGLIAAFMRMFSPGVAILGPVIGISIEAFSIAISVAIFGRNKLGFIIGGILALSMPLVQKIVNYLIVYGWDLVLVFDKTASYAISSLGLKGILPIHILLLLFSINTIVGMLVAYAGCRAGLGISKQTLENKFTIKSELPPDITSSRPAALSFIFILINISVIILLVILLKSNLAIAGILILFYILLIFFKYHKAIRYLKNYKFWLQLIIITSLTAVTYSYFLSGNAMSGFLKGSEMLLRVFLFTFGFAAISFELKNPNLINIIKSKANQNFITAFNFAFQSVPDLIASMPQLTSILKPQNFLSHLILQTEILLPHSEKYFTKEKE